MGTLVPGAALVLLGIVYLLQGNGSAAPMNISHLLPQWTGIAVSVLIVNNFLSYAGMEVNAVPRQRFGEPRQGVSQGDVLGLGARGGDLRAADGRGHQLGLPSSELSLTGGRQSQAIQSFFTYFHVSCVAHPGGARYA